MGEIYKGTLQQIHKYLVEEFGIIEKNAFSGREPGKYQLGPISQQLGKIYNSSDKIGKVYYTLEFNIDPEKTTHIITPSPIEGFTVESIEIQILDEQQA